MPRMTKEAMAEKLANEVYDYDIETLLECARDHERNYWLSLPYNELQRVYTDRCSENEDD